jgi:Na+/proline symporter
MLAIITNQLYKPIERKNSLESKFVLMRLFLAENIVLFSLIPVFSTKNRNHFLLYISHSLHMHIALKNQL